MILPGALTCSKICIGALLRGSQYLEVTETMDGNMITQGEAINRLKREEQISAEDVALGPAGF